MYTRLYQQCHGTSPATSSITKFMPPDSCNYYIEQKQNAVNIINDAVINIEYKFPCIDYNNLQKKFEKIVENESSYVTSPPNTQPQNTTTSQNTTTNDQSRFSPMVWGPAAWKFFETVAFGYPDNPTEFEKQSAFNFFESLRHLLPCAICKEHYDQNFAKLPVNVDSRDTLSRWVVDFHNIVNKSLNKPLVPYDIVAARYPKEECESCNIDALTR